MGQRALGLIVLQFKKPLLKTLKAEEGEEGVEIAIRVEEVHDDIKKVTASLADTPFDSTPLFGSNHDICFIPHGAY